MDENEIVTEIGKLNFKGNIIDNGWFSKLVHDNGKPNLVAIIILSEIVYWYKPTEVRDEETGKFLGYKKKFKADRLQRSYAAFSEQFGFSKKQVKDACNFLKDRNLIAIEFRTITINGQKYNNIMYVEPVPDSIEKISGFNKEYKNMFKQNVTENGLKSNQVLPYIHRSTQGIHESIEGGTSKYTPVDIDVRTNTENTTEINNNITKLSSSSISNLVRSSNDEEDDDLKKNNSGTDSVQLKELSNQSSGTDAVHPREHGIQNEGNENDEYELVSQVLEYFSSKACIPSINISGRDTNTAISWVKEKIPMQVILNGIDLAFERFKPQYESDKIRSLNFCDGCIRELFERKKSERLGGTYGTGVKTISFDGKHKYDYSKNKEKSKIKFSTEMPTINGEQIDTEHPEKYGLI